MSKTDIKIKISPNINLAEPVIRNANMISFDISAVRSSDASGNDNFSGQTRLLRQFNNRNHQPI